MKVPKESDRPPRRWAVAAVLAAIAALGVWGVRAWSGAGADPDRVWAQAQADFRAGLYDRAEASLARLAKLRAPTPLDRVLKAQLAMVGDRDDEALADLDLVPDADPIAAQARLVAGQSELRRFHARAAERRLLAAAAINPSLVQAHRELVYLYGVQLRRPELAAQFLALSRLTTLTYDNVFHWCLTRTTVWEPRETAATMRRFVDADPDDRWSRLSLAESLRQIGARGEAGKVLAALPGSDPDARVVRVRLALDRGDDRAAESLLLDGPADHPGLARLRGRVALARRDGPAAVRHFRAAYAAEPDHRDTIFGLGQALAMVGKHDEAAPFQSAARDYDALGSLIERASTAQGRKDPNLLRALGAACEQLHRLPEARAWYNLAIAADPLDHEAQKALFRLKSRETQTKTISGRQTPGSP